MPRDTETGAALQRFLLARLQQRMKVGPVVAFSIEPSLTRLRAGALAAAARGYDLAAAKRASALPIEVVALGFVLAADRAGSRCALDAGPAFAVQEAMRYLLSPASPTRAPGDALLGAKWPGAGRLTWTVLEQVASLPVERAIIMDDLVELIVADVCASERRRAAPAAVALARSYLEVLLCLLGAIGLASDTSAGVLVDTPRLQSALQDLASRRPEPDNITPARATLERAGDDLIVRAPDLVPLLLLVPLATITLPHVADGELVFRLRPRVASRHQILHAARAILA